MRLTDVPRGLAQGLGWGLAALALTACGPAAPPPTAIPTLAAPATVAVPAAVAPAATAAPVAEATSAPAAVEAEPMPLPDWLTTVTVVGDYYILGNPDAPIRLLDYGDFL